MSKTDQNNRYHVNIASYLKRMARCWPYKKAVIYPGGKHQGRVSYTHLTFMQLDQESDYLAHGLIHAGISKGTRTILMVRPCLDFFILIFSLFKIGAIPVVVDPGMGIQRMLSCLKESIPNAFIGIPPAHVVRKIFPGYFKTVQVWVTVGRRLFWGGHTLSVLKNINRTPFQIAKTKIDDTAAILFTTGSTGPAKGAVYTHGNFDAQLKQIKSHLSISTDEIDLSTFPLFALFWPALGITSVIPDMDPTKPALVDPTKIIEAIQNHGITNMFASPALLNRVGRYGEENNIKLPSLKTVISAGAPVSPAIIERFKSLLSDDAHIHTPYGATEAVPIISIKSDEILSETRMLSDQGYGVCVGRPINDMDIKVIRISDDPIETWSEDLLMDDGQIGEIVVKGDLVTRSYFKRPKADSLAKIRQGKEIWHRMGDLGRIDEKGRFWFCGRKSHRVITSEQSLYSVCCEGIFNTHPAVFRSALVGVGNKPHQTPLICIELETKYKNQNKNQLRTELLELARKHRLTEKIGTVLFHPAFPVDIRHNSKIFREKLTVWAEKKIK